MYSSDITSFFNKMLKIANQETQKTKKDIQTEKIKEKNKIVKSLIFHPSRWMIWSFLVFFIIVTFELIIEGKPSILTALAFLFLIFIIIVIQIVQFIGLRYPTFSQHWQFVAQYLVELYKKEGVLLSELCYGLKCSIVFYKSALKVYVLLITSFSFLVAFSKNYIGSSDFIWKFFGFTPSRFLAIIIVSAIWMFFMVYIPLSWRIYLEPYLKRELEKDEKTYANNV